MRGSIEAAAAAMALLAGGATAAAAADLSLPPLYQEEAAPMVELGSGWYLRGDLGYVNMGLPVSDPPVYINHVMAPAAAQSIFGAGQTRFAALGATLGAGYQFISWFRMDATFDWRNDSKVDAAAFGLSCALDVTNPVTGITTLTNNGGCYKVDAVRTQSWTGLLNFYGDLGNWAGFTPYLGGGLGLTHIQAATQESWFWDYGAPYGGAGYNLYNSATGVSVHYGYPGNVGPARNRVNFSWALMAGVSYDVVPHVKLDVGYRYLNMGFLDALNASGTIVHRAVDSQEARIGLRFTPDL